MQAQAWTSAWGSPTLTVTCFRLWQADSETGANTNNYQDLQGFSGHTSILCNYIYDYIYIYILYVCCPNSQFTRLGRKADLSLPSFRCLPVKVLRLSRPKGLVARHPVGPYGKAVQGFSGSERLDGRSSGRAHKGW